MSIRQAKIEASRRLMRRNATGGERIGFGIAVEDALRQWNRVMIGFDLLLGSATLLAPGATLRALGHDRAAPEAVHLFRRCGPIWLTFAAAHAVAAARGRPEDWWAVAWLRGTEIATDAVWSHSPALNRPGARPALKLAGLANLGMAVGYAWLARSRVTGVV